MARDCRIEAKYIECWVFHEAENVAGYAKGTGPIRFDLNRRHSSMAHVAWGPKGLVHSYDEYKQKYGRP